MSAQTIAVAAGNPLFPKTLSMRLGSEGPAQLFALGNVNLLSLPKSALFCSARFPGDAILRTHDQAAHWRDTGRCVISGFHSPIEKECLRILLRGKPPLIVCPARSIEKLRIPAEWRTPIAEGRLLILTCFEPGHTRATAELATRRNLIVAALADEHWFAHITPGGRSDQLRTIVASWPSAATP